MAKLNITETTETVKNVEIVIPKFISLHLHSNGGHELKITAAEIMSQDPHSLKQNLRDLADACQVLISKL